jgi:Trypsin-like peptidase domain
MRDVNQSGRPMSMVEVSEIPPAPSPAKVQHRIAINGSTPTPAPPISPEEQQSASQIIEAYHNSLVFVTGTDGSGSGFIATIGNANYLVTSTHVVTTVRDVAFKTLDGAVIKGGAPSMAVGEDIFCMALPPGGKSFEIMQGVDANVAIGDEVVVPGDAEGAGMVSTIIGRIIAIGPNLLEVDAPFEPGDSGSPIIHLKTGKVIGVAAYTVTDKYGLSTDPVLKQPGARRFGYRVDSVKGWQAVRWQDFDAQAAQMQGVETLTDDLYDFFRDLEDKKGVAGLDMRVNPVIKSHIDDWVTEKASHPGTEEAAHNDAIFISFLKSSSQSDITAAESQVTYDCFQRDLADQKQIRDQIEKALEQIIQGPAQ